jgi:glycosyltransferase involved in cell wall biosynthesis
VPESPRLRVLHVINGEYFGGSARVLTNYIESKARTAEIVVATFFPGTLADRCRELGVPTEVIRMASRIDPRAVREVVRIARRHSIDLIHSHQPRNTLVARLAKPITRRPLVTHVHSPAFRESTSRTRNVLVGAVDRGLGTLTDRYICVSESLRKELLRQRISPSRISVVANGVPVDSLPRLGSTTEQVRAEFGVAGDVFLIGMLANFRPRKGTEVLLEAVARARARGIPLHLLLIGEPFREEGLDYGQQLRERAAAADVSDAVTMTGFRADAERLLAGLDLFVLPSLFGEGLPMVLLEAMGIGVPVVSTPIEGIGDIVQDGRTGWLVPPGDADALSEIILAAAEDPQLRRDVAGRGREAILRGYSADRMSLGIESVYRDVLTARSSRRL